MTPARVDPVEGRHDGRERLLHTGLEIFRQRAFDDVPVSEITRQAGVAHGLLAYHFGSKRGFFLEVIRLQLEEVDQAHRANDIADPAAWLRKDVDIFLDNISRAPQSATTFARTGYVTDPDMEALIDTFWDGLTAAQKRRARSADRSAHRVTGVRLALGSDRRRRRVTIPQLIADRRTGQVRERSSRGSSRAWATRRPRPARRSPARERDRDRRAPGCDTFRAFRLDVARIEAFGLPLTLAGG